MKMDPIPRIEFQVIFGLGRTFHSNHTDLLRSNWQTTVSDSCNLTNSKLTLMAFICIWVLYRAHFHHFAFMIRKTKFKACYLLIYYHDKTKTVKGIHFVFSIILNLVHYSLHSSEITKIINWFTFAGAKIKAFEIKHHFLFDLCCGSTRKRTNVLNVFPTFYFRLNEL